MIMHLPLAVQLRPKNLQNFIGQTHLVGKNQPLRKLIESKQIFSMIFWGPPGVGKTTLARIIANETNLPIHELSAVSAGKNDVKKLIDEYKSKSSDRQLSIRDNLQNIRSNSFILFLDEIHRFNKAQQDFLLPYVEKGDLILIGATTENPSFEVISPLLSRTRVFVLKELSEAELGEIITKVAKTTNKKTKDWLTNYANGDARKLLTIIDNTLQIYDKLSIENLKKALQSNQLRYDKTGEEHYNTISAFIKSMRASNTDAALYYLARMVDSGEDPKFIARRMVIFASEDIGLAQPTALVVANAVFDAVHKIGYPEAQINLAHGVAYLCRAKKDRSTYDAYFAALADVKKHGNLPVPLELRNAPTSLMKNLNYGKNYTMYNNKNLLPDKLKNKKYL